MVVTVTMAEIVAPTDPQLAYIAKLCREKGWTPPDVVCSKVEAAEIIDSMKDATYRPERYAFPFGDDLPFR